MYNRGTEKKNLKKLLLMILMIGVLFAGCGTASDLEEITGNIEDAPAEELLIEESEAEITDIEDMENGQLYDADADTKIDSSHDADAGLENDTSSDVGLEEKTDALQDENKKEHDTISVDEGNSSKVPADSKMDIHFLDVGQGLSVFVQCDGKTLIFDGGDRETSSYVVAYLKNMGVETLDYLICSHYDSDHISGLVGCLSVFQVKNVICPDYVHDSKTYRSFVTKMQEKGLDMIHPPVGSVFDFGAAQFMILAPEVIDENNSNENSVAIKLIHGENSMVVTGDAESGSEAAMCKSGLDLSCDILVAGHHGSATATTWDFLMKTVPEYAVISCGKENSYGHPHEETMEKLESMEIQVYRTDKQGWISVVSDGNTLDWSQEPSNDYSSGETTSADTSVPAAETEESSKEQTEPEQNETDSRQYVLNTNTKRFHIPGCRSVGQMKENNKKEYTGTRDEVIQMGYRPCGNCHP